MNGRIICGVAVGLGVAAWTLFSPRGFAAQQAADWAPSLITIPSPVSANSGEPQLTIPPAHRRARICLGRRSR